MPEIIEDGRTGYLVDDVPGAVRALGEIERLSRHVCAAEARNRFSDVAMAHAYGGLYERLV